MTHAQWIYMAEVFQRREEKEREERNVLINEVYKASTRGLREMLVRLLGLNIGAGKAEEEGALTPFIPLVCTMSRSGILEELMKRDEEEEVIVAATNDENVDVVNDALMNLDAGDLEPIFAGQNSENPIERWQSDEHQAMLRALGVTVEPAEKP